MYKKIQTVFAVLLSLAFVLLSACTGNKAEGPSYKTEAAAKQTAVTLPQAERFEKLLNEDGKINTAYLEAETVSVIKKNYDRRIYIEHQQTPYFYNPVYISYDQIMNNRYIAADRKNSVLEESFQKAKESGFKSVALYVNWKDFYNGSTYNFEYYKIYYTLAEKYDLNVSIIWNGYAKTGFMPWQTDRTKYPALAITKNIQVPDLSQQIYIDEATEAITQFCAWLNYFDYNHRTVLIQLEDEANTNYGMGNWLSQFDNYAVLLEKMADAVKASPYKAVTTVGMTLDDYYTVLDDLSGRARIDNLFSKASIDGIGVADLTTDAFSIGMLSNSDKFCYVTKLSPATCDFFAEALNLITQGCQFGVYELKSFDLAVNCGMYRTHSTAWQLRDRQVVDRGILAKYRFLEAATGDVADFITAINNIGEILAVNSTNDINVFNPHVVDNYFSSLPIGDIDAEFNNLENADFTYNSAGLCVVDPYSNYYVFSFRLTARFTVMYDGEIKLYAGEYENGVWVPSGEATVAKNNSFTLNSGVVYKFRLDGK